MGVFDASEYYRQHIWKIARFEDRLDIKFVTTDRLLELARNQEILNIPCIDIGQYSKIGLGDLASSIESMWGDIERPCIEGIGGKLNKLSDNLLAVVHNNSDKTTDQLIDIQKKLLNDTKAFEEIYPDEAIVSPGYKLTNDLQSSIYKYMRDNEFTRPSNSMIKYIETGYGSNGINDVSAVSWTFVDNMNNTYSPLYTISISGLSDEGGIDELLALWSITTLEGCSIYGLVLESSRPRATKSALTNPLKAHPEYTGASYISKLIVGSLIAGLRRIKCDTDHTIPSSIIYDIIQRQLKALPGISGI